MISFFHIKVLTITRSDSEVEHRLEPMETVSRGKQQRVTARGLTTDGAIALPNTLSAGEALCPLSPQMTCK